MLITIISGVILFPVSMIRDMAGLSKFSGVAMAAVLVIAVSMTAVAPTLDDEFKGDISKPLTIINPEGIAGAINIFSFAYVCHQNLIINYHEMKNKTIKTFEKVSIVCLVLSAILTILMGSTYISFREKSDMNILNSFPLDNMVIIVCKILFAFDMMMSFPVGLYVVRDTIEHSFFIGKKFSYLRHTLVTIFLTVLCIGIACATCDLGVIIGTTGGLASVTIAFILPSACWLQIHRLQKQNLSIFSKVSHVLCIFFGVVLLGLTIYDFALGIINPSETKDCKWDGI